MRKRVALLFAALVMALTVAFSGVAFAAAAEFDPNEHAFQACGLGREFATAAVEDQAGGTGASESALISPIGVCTGP